MSDRPELSVILPTDGLETVQETLRHLAAQSARDRIELVIVTRQDDRFELPDDLLATFPAVRWAEVEPEAMVLLHRARAAGIRAASAPVIVLGETHSFPDPDWAEALIEAHRGPRAVVGPAMICANPERKVSWANFFIDFGPWVERRSPGTMDRLPGHNSAYKRDLLLALGPRLDEALESEWHLQGELRAQGHELWFEPAARTRHLNVVGRVSLRARFDHGRLWAVGRVGAWSTPKRLLYIAGTPLIPFRRLPAILREVRRTGRGRDVGLIGLIWVELAADAAGELVGYVRRRNGSSEDSFTESELHRIRFAGVPARETARNA